MVPFLSDSLLSVGASGGRASRKGSLREDNSESEEQNDDLYSYDNEDDGEYMLHHPKQSDGIYSNYNGEDGKYMSHHPEQSEDIYSYDNENENDNEYMLHCNIIPLEQLRKWHVWAQQFPKNKEIN